MTDHRSFWLAALHKCAFAAQTTAPKFMLGDYRTSACPSCASPGQIIRGSLPAYSLLHAEISLADLPEPRPGLIEWGLDPGLANRLVVIDRCEDRGIKKALSDADDRTPSPRHS